MSTRLVFAARLALGSIFFVFGLNGFLGFMPQPAMPEAAGAFLGGLAGAGYMFPMIKGTEVVVGLALLAGRFVPLALTVAAPVVLNITAFHLFLAPGGLGISSVLLGLGLFLAYAHRDAYRTLVAARAEPQLGGAAPVATRRLADAT